MFRQCILTSHQFAQSTRYLSCTDESRIVAIRSSYKNNNTLDVKNLIEKPSRECQNSSQLRRNRAYC